MYQTTCDAAQFPLIAFSKLGFRIGWSNPFVSEIVFPECSYFCVFFPLQNLVSNKLISIKFSQLKDNEAVVSALSFDEGLTFLAQPQRASHLIRLINLLRSLSNQS